MAATTDESTPPENATTALPSAPTRASRAGREVTEYVSGIPSDFVAGSERLGPDDLHRRAADLSRPRAVGVLGREIDHPAIELADLDPDRLASDLDGEALALELDPVQ